MRCKPFIAGIVNSMISPKILTSCSKYFLFNDCINNLETMFKVIESFPKLYTACHTDESGIKPGINLDTADKRVAGPSSAEFLGIKSSVFDV